MTGPSAGRPWSRYRPLWWIALPAAVVLGGVLLIRFVDSGQQPSSRSPATWSPVSSWPGSAAGTTIPQAAGDLTPEMYGAKGNGVTDDTAALQAALAALTPGHRLYLSAGHTYPHAQVLQLRTASTGIVGSGRLLATDVRLSELWVDADKVTLSGITVACVNAATRFDAFEQMKIRVGEHAGTTISGVTVDGSAAAGILLEGSSNFAITDTRIRNTRADGIHMTNGAHDGTITRVSVTHPGDDGIAVVSYGDDGADTTRITVDSSSVTDQSWGRGFSVVGGTQVTFNNIFVNGSSGAGIYIATEGEPYNTRSVSTVTVNGGRIERANQNTAVNQGAIMIYSGRADTSIAGVTITGVTITGSRSNNGAEVDLSCDGGSASAVVVHQLRLSGQHRTPFANSCGSHSAQGLTDDAVAS